MLAESAPEIKPRSNLIKKFARSRSRSNSNPPDSPRPSLSNSFSPKFIPNTLKHTHKNNSHNLSLSLGQAALENLHTQLKIMQLQKELQTSETQRKMLHRQNQKLKEQIAELQSKLPLNYQIRQPLKENRCNQNLAKLKRQIAQTREAETRPSLCQLEQQNRILLAENARLKASLHEVQNIRDTLSPRSKHNPRDHLQETISRLQNQLKDLTDQNRQLDLHLKVMLARIANQEKNAQSVQNQELQVLKIKYSKLIAQHQMVRKELALRKRKERTQPKILIVEDRSRSVSLQLSPDGQ